jgi:hypothetical protein
MQGGLADSRRRVQFAGGNGERSQAAARRNGRVERGLRVKRGDIRVEYSDIRVERGDIRVELAGTAVVYGRDCCGDST